MIYRVERKRLLRARRVEVTLLGEDNLYLAKSDTGKPGYRVSFRPGGHPVCECIDYRNGSIYCKHVAGVLLYLGLDVQSKEAPPKPSARKGRPENVVRPKYIRGQEAICPGGLGRVKSGYIKGNKIQYEIILYITKQSVLYLSEEVDLIDPCCSSCASKNVSRETGNENEN